MPRGWISRTDKLKSSFLKWYRGKMRMEDVTQKDLAKLLNCDSSKVSLRLSGNTTISYMEWVVMMDAVGATDEERLMFCKF